MCYLYAYLYSGIKGHFYVIIGLADPFDATIILNFMEFRDSLVRHICLYAYSEFASHDTGRTLDPDDVLCPSGQRYDQSPGPHAREDDISPG